MSHEQPEGYEVKFANFIQMIADAKAKNVESVLVGFPWVLGDNYAEIIESLSRLSEAQLSLHVAARYDHNKHSKPTDET